MTAQKRFSVHWYIASLEIHAMISSWYTDGKMDSMVWADNLNFPLKMTVDGISQWNFVLVSLFKLPQKKTRFFIVFYFCLVSESCAFSTVKIWVTGHSSDPSSIHQSDLNTQTGSCLIHRWLVYFHFHSTFSLTEKTNQWFMLHNRLWCIIDSVVVQYISPQEVISIKMVIFLL